MARKTLILLLGVFLICSCKSSEEKSRKEILAEHKWVWIKGVVDPAIKDARGDSITDYYGKMTDNCYHDNTYVFKSDGTGYVDQGKIKCKEEPSGKFSWSLNEEEVLLRINEEYVLGSKVLTMAKINEEYMTLTWHYSSGTSDLPLSFLYTDTYKAVK